MTMKGKMMTSRCDDKDDNKRQKIIHLIIWKKSLFIIKLLTIAFISKLLPEKCLTFTQNTLFHHQVCHALFCSNFIFSTFAQLLYGQIDIERRRK